MPSEPKPAASTQQPNLFLTTHWSVVLTAAEADSPHAAQALEQLCRAYWYPLYAYVRRRGYDSNDAQDLTQSFFARLLERNYVGQADRRRGKFRTFLLSALSHFLANEWDHAHRLKRGGDQTLISFDAATAEERYSLEPVDLYDPAKLFERRWATTLLERALARLEQEFNKRGQGRLFEACRPFMLGEQGEATYTEAAPASGTTPATMKMGVSRMRARYRELLRQEILQTVASPQEAEEEYRELQAALRR